MTKRNIPRLISSIALLGLCLPALADQTWKGATDNLWTTPGNWSGNAIPTSADSVVYNSASTANLSNSLSQAFTIKGISVSNVPGPVSINSSSTLTLSGTLSGTNGFEMSQAAQSLTVNGPLALGAGQAWVVGANQSLNLLGPVSGGFGFFKDGPGTLFLYGTNSFTGNVTNGAGQIWVNNSASLGTGTKTITVAANNVGIHLNGANGNITLPSSLSWVASDVAGTIVNEAGDNTVAGPISVFSGGGAPYFAVNAGTLAISGNITLGTTARPFILGGAGDGTDSGTIVGTGLALTKSDAGTWTLTAKDTYTGVTTITGGTLAISTNGSISNSASISIASNATLDVSQVVSGGSNYFFLNTSQILAGSGTVTGSVATTGNVAIQPGGNSTNGTLSFSNDLFLSGTTTNYFELNSDNTAGSGSNDLIVVGGNLDPRSARIVITPVSVLTSSPYRLFNYTGSKLSTFNSTIVTDSRYTFTLDESVANQINVSATGTIISNLVWRGSGTTSTWNLNSTANWNTNTLTFFNYDPVTFDDTGVATNVNLVGALRPVSVNVTANDSNYVIYGTGKISGLTGITKSGAGTLSISNTTHDFTGPITINGGILTVTNVALNGSASSLGAGTTIILDGGTFQFGGARPPASTFNRFWTLGPGGGTILSTNGTFFIPNVISGSGNLTKTGTVQVILGDIVTGATGNANNTYTGDTYINQGELQIRNAHALGTGKAFVASGADLSVGGGATYGTVANDIDLNGGDGNNGNGALQVNDGGTSVTYGGTINLIAGSSVGTINNGNAVTFIISGAITNIGYLKKLGTNSVILTGANTYSGGTLISSGTLQVGNGGAGGTLGSGAVTNNSTLAFNHNDSLTVNNVISGTGLFTHKGSGTLTLGGANSYTGTTTISAGTVLVNGSLGTNTVTIAGGATLGGNGGMINGAVTVQNNGTLALGPAIGTLAFGSTLSFSSTSTNTMKLNKTGAVLSNDSITGVTTLTFNGRLNVTTSGDPLQGGDTFQLFNATTYFGSFASTNLPALGPGLFWDTSGLGTGTLMVASAPAVTVVPASTNAECGGSIMFTTTSSGVPAPSFQWYDNSGTLIPNETNSNFTLANVHTAQNGAWSVVVSNSFGKATNSSLLTVEDTTAPVITCPATISLVVTGASGANVGFTVTATDSCDTSPAVVSVPASGSFFPAGTNIVISTATDSSGNSNTCSFQIIIDRAPVVTANATASSPENKLLTLNVVKLLAVVSDPDNDPLSVTGAGLTSTNGGAVMLSGSQVTYQPTTNFIGSDSFQYTVSDGRGGTATNLMVINVTTTNAPSVNVAYGPVVIGGQFIVRFAGIPGYTYTIESTDDLVTPAWAKKTNLTAPTTDQGFGIGIFEFSESVGAATNRFYRTIYPSY